MEIFTARYQFAPSREFGGSPDKVIEIWLDRDEDDGDNLTCRLARLSILGYSYYPRKDRSDVYRAYNEYSMAS